MVKELQIKNVCAAATITKPSADNSKLEINKYVARNSVLFSNALVLIKVGELAEVNNYNEGLKIINLQIIYPILKCIIKQHCHFNF